MHDDLVERVFTATRLNQLWLTDVNEHWTDAGKLYLCAIKDVRSNKIVGYSIDDWMKASLAVAALNYAIKARPHAGTIVHSDYAEDDVKPRNRADTSNSLETRLIFSA